MSRVIEYPFSIFDINTANDFYWDENFNFKGESHNFFEIVCVLDGAVESVEDEKVYILHRGDMVLHAPMEFHRIKSALSSRPHVLIMSFHHSGELPSILSEGVFSLTDGEICEYERIFGLCYEFLRGEGEQKVGMSAGLGLCDFLLRLSSSHIPGDTASKGKRAEEYRRIVDVMQAGIGENLTLSEIAVRSAVSLSSMKLLFKEFSGESPKLYYSKLRLREACRLLDTGASVAEVAIKLGFSSPNYFSLFFKRNVGMLPKSFKR